MVVDARPDLIGAIIVKLRASAELSALCGTRISGALQDAWDPMPRHAVLVRSAGGPPGLRQINVNVSRVDVFCYGSTAYEAMRLWRQLDAVFCPGQERVVSFTESGCRVYSVDPESMPLADVEINTNWPRAVSSYLVTWCGVPA